MDEMMTESIQQIQIWCIVFFLFKKVSMLVCSNLGLQPKMFCSFDNIYHKNNNCSYYERTVKVKIAYNSDQFLSTCFFNADIIPQLQT